MQGSLGPRPSSSPAPSGQGTRQHASRHAHRPSARVHRGRAAPRSAHPVDAEAGFPLQPEQAPESQQASPLPADPAPPPAQWWGRIGHAASVVAVTGSVLLAGSHAAFAWDVSARTPPASPSTATYAPAMQQLARASGPQAASPQQPQLEWQLQPLQEPGAIPSMATGFAWGQQPAVQSMQGSGTYPVVSDVASEAEDNLLEVIRQLEARVDSAVGAVVRSGPRLPFNIMGTTAVTSEEEKRINDTAATLISEVWEVVDQNYLDARSTGWDREHWKRLRDAALGQTYSDTASVYRAIRELMAWGLSDPYCRFITPEELAAMKKYDVTGVGLNLGSATEYQLKTGRPLPLNRTSESAGVFVVGLSKGSPADKVGIRQGDEILEVDGVSLRQQTPFQAASLIAGQQSEGESAADTQRQSVELKVRKMDGMTTTVEVERPVRLLKSPVSATLAKGPSEPVGVLRLSSFNARAQRDLKYAIEKLEEKGAKSLVLDLRDNRGGLVSEGLEVARLFLEGDSPIVFTESRTIQADVPRAAGQPFTQLPLLVLVNEHTASASEIVAGALHDNCRAVLVGSRTYGKGLIQSVYELSDGSGLVLTVGKYLTPNRLDIDRSGIQPDFSSRPSPRLAAETINACKLNMTERPAPAAAAASTAQRM